MEPARVYETPFFSALGIRELRSRLQWPAGVRLPVILTFDYQAEVGAPERRPGVPDFVELSERHYGIREGVPRILRSLAQRRILATFFVSGRTAEWYPHSVRSIADGGHEVGGHGYLHLYPADVDAGVEAQEVAQGIAALIAVTGTRPLGWRCPGSQLSPRTLPLLVEHGITWNSDLRSPDAPLLLMVGDRPLVEIPYSWTISDSRLVGFPRAPVYGRPRVMLETWQDEFQVLYREAEFMPRCLVLCLHPFVSGRPARWQVVEEFLDWVKRYPDVVFLRGEDAAACVQSLDGPDG